MSVMFVGVGGGSVEGSPSVAGEGRGRRLPGAPSIIDLRSGRRERV